MADAGIGPEDMGSVLEEGVLEALYVILMSIRRNARGKNIV